MTQHIALLFLLAAEPPTFHKDVQPILQRRCQACHRPGEVAPMPLLTYEQARPWAKAIKEAATLRRMPPWSADPAVGHFKNDRLLAQSEIDVLRNWADAGAPAGDPKEAPAPLQFTNGWTIPPPDAILEMPQALDVPASGVVDYQWVVIPTGFKEDKWISAIEARPGERSVVHHIAVTWRRKGSQWLSDAKPGVPLAKPADQAEAGMADGILAEYVPGATGTILAPGYGILLPAGADIVLQLHYTPNGKPARDISRVGFVFAKERPQNRVITLVVANREFTIPPGDPNYRIDASATFDTEVELLSLFPHMHLRGKSFEMRAVSPTGESTPLFRSPKYDFNWQITYELATPMKLAPGSRIEASGWFDNSKNNPWNPDPSRAVPWGDQTTDEMMIGFAQIALPADADLRQLLRRSQYPSKKTE